MAAYFMPETLKFLSDLSKHNDREWFTKNKERYETDVKEPMLRFIANLGPQLKKLAPSYVADLADDMTLDGSLLEGVVQGKDAVRAIVVAIRSLYDRQEHRFAGPFRDKEFLEEYVAEVHGEPSVASSR